MTSSDTPKQSDSSVSSSDESVEEVDTPYTTKELVALVKKLEIQNAEYQHQLQKLNSGTASSVSTPATPGTPQNPLDEHADEFNQLGRLFCVLNEIWVRKFHLCQPYPEGLRQIGPWHAERYRSDQSKRDGVVAELYEFVPLHFHQYLEGSHFFAEKFTAGAKSMRSYIISNVRSHASAIFPLGAEQKVYAVGFDRSGIPEIVTLLRNPNQPAETHPRYCSVLYKDGVIMGSKVFSGVAILNILKVILLGPTSLTRAVGSSRSGPPPLAKSADLKSVTPRLVTMATAVARFILSNDSTFRDVGAESRIKYLDDFNHYKKFISDNFEAPGLVATFAQLNWEIFGTSSPASGPMLDGQNEDPDNDEEEARMRAELWGEQGNSNMSSHTQSPEPDPPTSSHLPSAPALIQQPETSSAPRSAHKEHTAWTRKTRSKGSGKATGGATEGDDAAAEPVRRGGVGTPQTVHSYFLNQQRFPRVTRAA